jgi:lipoprotein-releasing system permease protein
MGNRYLSFISLVSLIGMVLGVIALIVVVSVMNGFDTELKRRILGVVPHVVVSEGLDLTLINADDRVLASAPFISRSGLLLEGKTSQLVTLQGIDSDVEHMMSILPSYMVQGSMEDLSATSTGIIVGRPLAYRLGAMIGDRLTMIIPEPSIDGNRVTPKIAKFQLVGTFELNSEVDYRLAMVNYTQLQQIVGASTIDTRLRLVDVFDAPAVSAEITAGLFSGDRSLKVINWTDQYGDFFETVKMEKIMMFLLLSLIVAIAAFNIVSSLSMMVKDKRSDIAVLRTFGLSPGGIMRIFMIQGAVIGVMGVLIGTILGLLLASHITEVVGFFEELLGSRMLAGTYFDSVPSDVRYADIFIIVLVALMISFLATLYPAWRAASLQPAEVLRNE